MEVFNVIPPVTRTALKKLNSFETEEEKFSYRAKSGGNIQKLSNGADDAQ